MGTDEQCYWPDGSRADGLIACPQMRRDGHAPCCWVRNYDSSSWKLLAAPKHVQQAYLHA